MNPEPCYFTYEVKVRMYYQSSRNDSANYESIAFWLNVEAKSYWHALEVATARLVQESDLTFEVLDVSFVNTLGVIPLMEVSNIVIVR